MDRPRLRHRASRAARPATMPSPRSNSRSASLHSKPHRASRATATPTTPITRSRRATAIRSIRPRSRSRTTATRLPASPVRMVRMARMASSPSRAVCSVSALPVPVRRTVKVRPSRDSPVSPAPPSRACPRRRATSSSPWSPPFWLRPSAWASATAPSPAA